MGITALAGVAIVGAAAIADDLYWANEQQRWRNEHPGVQAWWQATWLESYCFERRWSIP